MYATNRGHFSRRAFARTAGVVLLSALPTAALAKTDHGAYGADLISSIGISIVIATVLAYLANLGKQPLLLAYLIAGVIVGPKIGLGIVSNQADIEVIAEIGLILLLFMIGLEINVRKLLESGRALVVAGVLQFVLCVLLGIGFFGLIGYSVGQGSYDLLYLAICCAMSSTTIVVKLLYEKFELDTLAGRITVGILVFQDIWAIVVLGVQPNLADPQALKILWSFAKGGLLVLASLTVSKYVLGAVFRRIAKLPELVLVASLAWVFLVAGAADALGLSREMGALIAGIAISTFPYNLDVISKIVSIRDFFLTLFFVGLGMQIPNPVENADVLRIAAIASAFLIVSRFLVVYPILYLLGNGNRVGLLVSINLSQISEFALVVAALGAGLGHIQPEILSVVIFVFAVTSVLSTYMIKFSHPLQMALSKLLRALGIRDIPGALPDTASAADKEIAILGFFRVASALIRQVQDECPELLKKMVVVDFNPVVHRELQTLGVKVIYGDIAHLDTLHHAGIGGAKIVVSTIPDAILKGTDNVRIIRVVKNAWPHAKIIATAESPRSATRMYSEGADYVLLPNLVAAKQVVPVINTLLESSDASLRSQEVAALALRREVLS
jgi:Kef-type K+ transport system membrane component KefB/Trk K+ transport system NAD-binding subunit